METRELNTKYAIIQAGYFAIVCCILGFAAVYLGALGFGSSQIGIIIAVGSILTTFAQPTLASFVDKNHLSLNRVLVLLALCGIVISLAILIAAWADISLVTAVLFVLLNAALMCMMPILNTLAFAFEDYGIKLNYGLARGIGSAAYAITSLIMGFVVAHINPKLMPILYVAILAGLIPQINGFKVKGKKRTKRTLVDSKPTGSTIEFLKSHSMFLIFLGGFVLVYLDQVIINNFFIYFIENVGGNTSDMGIAVFLAAILELVSMTALERIKDKVNISSLLIFSSIMFSVKHILTWLARSMFMIYVAQFFQMFAYAIFIPASVYYVNQLFQKEDAVKGQASVTMSMTASSVIASLLGGFLIDAVGPSSTLLIGAIISIIGTGIMIWALRSKPE